MEAKKIGKGVVWNTVGTIYYYFCQWVITILVVRLTDYSMAGYLSLAITVTNSFYAVAQFGMRQFQVSDINEKYHDSIYIGSRYITIAAAYIACAVYSFLCGYDRTQLLCIMAYMILKSVEAYVDVCQGIDQKAWRFDIIGISFFVRGTIVVAGFRIILAVTGNLPVTLAAISVISLIAALLIDVYCTSRFTSVRGRIADIKILHLLKECLPIVGFNFLLGLVTLLARNELSFQYGIDLLGIYSSVASPAVVIQLFASVVFNPFIPFFAEAYNEKKAGKYFMLVGKFSIMLIAIAVTAVTAAYFFGEWALVILIGQKIAPYSYLLIPVIGCTIVTAAIWLLAGVLIAIRKTAILLISTVIGLICGYLMCTDMIKLYDMNGVSYTVIIAGVIQIVIMFAACILCMKKRMK